MSSLHIELSRTCLLGGASILGDITQRDRDFIVSQKVVKTH